MKVLAVIPTYNEAENLPALMESLFALPVPGLEVLVVDDSSPDGTGELARSLSPRFGGRIHVLARPGKLGLGTAYIEGFRWALGHVAEAVVQMDADLSHNPSYIPSLLDALSRSDVAVGSRYAKGGGVDPSWGLSRRLLSRWGNFYARAVTGIRVKDITSGFKAFGRQALERLDMGAIKSRGFGFQVEVAFQCQRLGLRVEEVPIVFLERARGRSKISRRIVWEALWRVWGIRLGR